MCSKFIEMNAENRVNINRAKKIDKRSQTD